MEVRAVTKYVGISPQKTRWVIDQIRGMNAEQALSLLRFMPQSAADPVAKTVASALANAEENLGLSRGDMYIASIMADGAPVEVLDENILETAYGTPVKIISDGIDKAIFARSGRGDAR